MPTRGKICGRKGGDNGEGQGRVLQGPLCAAGDRGSRDGQWGACQLGWRVTPVVSPGRGGQGSVGKPDTRIHNFAEVAETA